MARKTKIAYWLLPAAALCVAASLAVAPSYARYDNSSAWHTVVAPEKLEVESPFLGDSSRPLIVLAGQMDGQPKEISVTLQANGNTAGALQWQLDKPEYVDIAVQAGETAIASGDTVSLTADAPTQITVTLTPTEKATQPHAKMTAVLQLSFGENLAGTFWVELPAVEGTTSEDGENTDPVEQQTEETTEDAPAVEGEEISEKSEITPSEGSGEEETPENSGTEDTQPDDTQPEETPQPTVSLQAPAGWYPQSPIALGVTAQTSTVVSLGLLAEETAQPLPAGTRFSLDNGSIWFALYEPDNVQLSAAAGQTQTVLLDLSHTELKNQEKLIFITEGGAQATVSAFAAPLYEISGNILTTGGAITLTMPTLWENVSFTYSVEMLTATEAGTTYVPVTLSEGALQAELTETEKGQLLTLSIAEKIPPAGTYRLRLLWQEGEREMMDAYEHFFIHYNENAGGER